MRFGSWITVSALAALVAGASAAAQQTVAGFARRVRGDVLRYHAPLPDVADALLVRHLDAERSIEWETEAVPTDHAGDDVSLVWMFGLDVDAHGHTFELRVDGEPWLTFDNPRTTAVRDWTVPGPAGSELRFRATMVDRFDDLMGFATLRLPRPAWRPGEPVRLTVAGESAGSRNWYMTFQAPVREHARLSCAPALLRDERGGTQPLDLDIVHLGEPTDAVITTSFGPERRVRLQLGGNRIVLHHAAVTEPRDVGVQIRVGDGERHALEARVHPVRPWHIDLVQHTHTDIGYTRPQTEILPEHVRFLDTALDLCDRTDTYPDDARFRWTCEVTWAVREFLETRPRAQIERLRQRANEGRIEVTGVFLNVSDLLDEAAYAASLQPVRAIRKAGIPVTTAMKNDVNGAAWSLADWASDLGIRFLTMGQHGHRALVPFDVPTCFWWESKSGERVLAFRADHYLTGNFWGLHTGDLEVVEPELLRYVQALEHAGYPFDRIAVQHSGYATDNAPPSTASSDLVRAWNDKYVWPRLRCSIARDFLQDVESRHGDALPVIRAAWPDWWTDGFGSAPRETAAARETQARLAAVEALLAFLRLAGIEAPDTSAPRLREARDAVAFYFEHTFGASESIRDPLGENTVVQWSEKAAYAWDAVKRTALLEESALGALTATLDPAESTRLVVFNPLGFTRSGVVELYADLEALPVDRPFRLVDEYGHALAVQRLRNRAEGSYWAIRVEDVPPLGLRSWRVVTGSSDALPGPARRRAESVLENAHFRIAVDGDTGSIASLIDRHRNVELVDSAADWQLGQLIHEALGNREQLEAFTLEDYERRAMENVAVEGVTPGPIWDALALRGELPGCDGVRCEIRLHHAEPLVELRYTIRKRRVVDPEALYVAFPFAMPDACVVFETVGGITSPDGGIIPGTASDWQAMLGFVAAQGPAGQVVLGSPGIPLVQLGAIHTGEFQPIARVARPHVFSWVANNYWTTNFAAAWDGELRFGYALTSSPDASHGFASRFGRSRSVPFLGRILTARTQRETGAADALPSVMPDVLGGVQLVSARPASRHAGVVLLLREVDGHDVGIDAGGLHFAGHPARVSIVNAIEEVIAPVEQSIEIAPFASAFVLIEPRR